MVQADAAAEAAYFETLSKALKSPKALANQQQKVFDFFLATFLGSITSR